MIMGTNYCIIIHIKLVNFYIRKMQANMNFKDLFDGSFIVPKLDNFP